MPFGGLLTLGVTAGTSIIGGLLGSSASDKAAKEQSQAAQHVADLSTQAGKDAAAGVSTATGKANSTLGDVLSQEKTALSAYQTAGSTGLTGLSDLLKPGGALTQQFSFNPGDLTKDPGYQFMLDQGTQALERSAASRGLLGSGGTLKSLTRYAQGLAGTEFQNAYNRALTTFGTNRQSAMDRLSGYAGLAGMGQGANAMLLNSLQNYGNTTSGNLMGGAEYSGNAGLTAAQIAGQALTGGAAAQAAGTIGSANAWNAGLGGVGNAAQYYGLSNLMNPGSSSTYNPLTFVPPNASNSSIFTPVDTTLPPPPSLPVP